MVAWDNRKMTSRAGVSVFLEDTALMRPDRVMARLDEWLEKARREYDATPCSNPEWSVQYKRYQGLKDTITHVWLTQAR